MSLWVPLRFFCLLNPECLLLKLTKQVGNIRYKNFLIGFFFWIQYVIGFYFLNYFHLGNSWSWFCCCQWSEWFGGWVNFESKIVIDREFFEAFQWSNVSWKWWKWKHFKKSKSKYKVIEYLHNSKFCLLSETKGKTDQMWLFSDWLPQIYFAFNLQMRRNLKFIYSGNCSDLLWETNGSSDWENIL